MQKSSRMLVLFICLTIVIASFTFLSGQPIARRPQPPGSCNNNGICQSEEADNSSCGDCNPLNPYKEFLDLSGTADQVFTFYEDPPSSMKFRVGQYKYFEDGAYSGYKLAWASDLLESIAPSGVRVGDIDGDESPEVVAIAYKTYTSKKITSLKQQIYIFKSGSAGIPDSVALTSITAKPRDMAIADADNDGENELIIARGNTVEVYGWANISSGEPLVFTGADGMVTGALHLEWASGDLGSVVFGIDVGDADNDGTNELVLARFDIGSVQIWKFENGEWTSSLTESIGAYNIDHAKVVDVDGDGDNEIIAGGNSKTLTVWKYENMRKSYPLVYRSQVLGGFNDYVNAADIDDDGNVEIFTAGNITNELYVFGVENSTQGDYFTNLNIKYSIPVNTGCSGLFPIYNLSMSPTPGIAAGFGSFSIYTIVGDQLYRAFNSFYGAGRFDVYRNQ